MNDSDAKQIQRQLNDLFEQLAEIKSDISKIEQRCGPHLALVAAHEIAIRGNGKNGLLVDIAKVKAGRVDTVSVKSVCRMIASFGAAIAMVIGAMATFG